MKLADFLKPLDLPSRKAFAARCDTTYSHLRNVAFSGKTCGTALAVDVERESTGAVRRWESRPHDWHRHWPELVTADGAPPVPQPEEKVA